MKEFDYFIVGRGIAGTNLAHTLLKHGKRILIFDSPQPDTSSKVAAGLLNPVTGRKMNLTWLADELFSFLKIHYTELEDLLRDFSADQRGVYESFKPPLAGHDFYHPMPVYRPFIDAEQQNDRMGIAFEKDGFSEFISPQQRPYPALIHDELGGLMLSGGGFVDLPTLLSKHRRFLLSRQALTEREVSEEDFEFSEKEVRFEGCRARKVIFCRGASDARSRLFSFLKFRPVKGEILDLRLSEPGASYVINRGNWVIPVGENIYRCGSTYDHKNLDSIPTEEGRLRILKRLKKLLKTDFEVLAHRAGVRPATYDTKPFVGEHPEIPSAVIFSGFGSKGVSLTPYFAEALYKYLSVGKALPKETAPERCL